MSASQKATLSCEVPDIKTDVKWYKDGKQLSSRRTVHMEARGKSRQLVLDSIEKKDAGEYICEAGNEKLVFNVQVSGIEDCLFEFELYGKGIPLSLFSLSFSFSVFLSFFLSFFLSLSLSLKSS